MAARLLNNKRGDVATDATRSRMYLSSFVGIVFVLIAPAVHAASEYYQVGPQTYVHTTSQMFGSPLDACINITRASHTDAAAACLASAPDTVHGETATTYGVITKIGAYYANYGMAGVYYDVRVYSKKDGRLIDRDPSQNFLIDLRRIRCEFIDSEGRCVDAVDKSNGLACPVNGVSLTANGTNPINSATGNKYQLETDYAGVGTFPLVWQRHYNSTNNRNGRFGLGWRHSYESRIALEPSTSPRRAIVQRPSGQALAFTETGAGGAWTSDPDIVARLETSSGGFRYTDHTGSVELFDQAGRLIERISPRGKRHQLVYSGDHLVEIRASDERTIRLNYDNIGRITQVATQDGEYKYEYTPKGALAFVQYPDGARREYRYEDSRFPHALTGIIDERGTRYATWTYDSKGRAVSSEHAGQDKHTLVYGTNGTTTITNALSKKTTYTFQTIYGAPKITKVTGQPTTSCLGANQAYTYTSEGWLETKTDWNGAVTRYSYNERGLEISRTEAEGRPEVRVVTTEWDPAFRLPIRITEPDRVTAFSYDHQGRQLEKRISSR